MSFIKKGQPYVKKIRSKIFLDLVKKTNDSRFAVVNTYNVVVGVVAMRDVTNKKNDTPLNKVMTRADVARASMTVASVSQKMIYEAMI